MKDLNEIYSEINVAVEMYEVCKLSQTSEQSEILRKLSVNLHYLSDYKVIAHEKWLNEYFKCKETTSAAKERFADRYAPEIYKIRQLLNSGNKVMDSVRSTLSANKRQD